MALRSLRPAGPIFATVAAVVVATTLLASCGGGADDAIPDGPVTTPSSATTGSSSGSPPPTDSPEREYPAGGPIDPLVPPSLPTYPLIGSGRCGELLDNTDTWQEVGVPDAEGLDTTPLYRAAALVCLGRWAEADQQYRQIRVADPRFENERCARLALLEWLGGLIHDWRADHRFSPTFVPSSAPSPCPDESSTTDSTDTTDTDGTTGTDGTGTIP